MVLTKKIPVLRNSVANHAKNSIWRESGSEPPSLAISGFGSKISGAALVET
jgi:hypothetical protein